MMKPEDKPRLEDILAQLNCLKEQVNPHFLFNSFSILASLIHIDPPLSSRFVEHLSRSYRYALDNSDRDLVPLSVEIDFLLSYVFVLKVRFSDKFDLQLDFEDKSPDTFHIPPLTLRILIENAVRHNQMSRARPLIVGLTLEENVLTIKNNLQLRPVLAKGASGTLQNLIDRYMLITGQQMWAGETENYFMVKIPLIVFGVDGEADHVPVPETTLTI